MKPVCWTIAWWCYNIIKLCFCHNNKLKVVRVNQPRMFSAEIPEASRTSIDFVASDGNKCTLWCPHIMGEWIESMQSWRWSKTIYTHPGLKALWSVWMLQLLYWWRILMELNPCSSSSLVNYSLSSSGCIIPSYQIFPLCTIYSGSSWVLLSYDSSAELQLSSLDVTRYSIRTVTSICVWTCCLSQ